MICESHSLRAGVRPGALLVTLLTIAAALSGCHAKPDINGTWQGTLDLSKYAPAGAVGGAKLTLITHFTKQSDGTYTGKLDSPDQRTTGLAIDTVTFADNKVHFDMKLLNLSYDGTLNGSGTEIAGTFKQGAVTAPLTLTKGS